MKKILFSTAVLACLGLVLFLMFRSKDKIEPDMAARTATESFSPARTGKAVLENVTDWYEAVGTVRPGSETRTQAQITAQVVAVNVKPGASVKKGQLLITLDNRRFLSRLDQARQAQKAAIAAEKQAEQAVIAAQAAFSRTESAYNRTRKYFASQAATEVDLEKAEAAFLQAKAELGRVKESILAATAGIQQAREVVNEAEIALGYTEIKAPADSEVLKRMVEPGDLALPGRPLLVLKTSEQLRLEAFVREGLINKVKPGDTIRVIIDTLATTVNADVEEIIPYADPQTRTFLVKASLPEIDGLFPGMFAKLLIPVKEHQAVLIPDSAVRRVGQLELLHVKRDTGWRLQYIKTGRLFDDRIEVLSGLSGGETIALGGAKE